MLYTPNVNLLTHNFWLAFHYGVLVTGYEVRSASFSLDSNCLDSFSFQGLITNASTHVAIYFTHNPVKSNR